MTGRYLRLFLGFFLLQLTAHGQQLANQGVKKETIKVLEQQVLKEAEWTLKQEPVTVTAETSAKSAGTKNDFFSEADYFWPNPANPDGPYKERDGETNPNNFLAHRKAMIRFDKIIGALAAAYKLTGDEKYVKQALKHLNAWFINADTKMNPNLQYAQAVKGQSTGRSWGIIDGVHLMEVAQGAAILEKSKLFDKNSSIAIKKWFGDFMRWLNTSKNGIAERDSKNNHSTCWVMQVAAFAKFCGDEAMLDSCRTRYKTILLPRQMAADGSFPLEMARTKPYGYAIFNLDAMTTICQILSTKDDNLWEFATTDGKSVKKGIEFLYPFVNDKSKWALKPDVMFWNDWPVAQPFLIFGAGAYDQEDWFLTWKRLDHDPKVDEVIRNVPIRNPLIWLN